MKKYICIVTLLCLTATLSAKADNAGQTIAVGLGRGLVNVVTSVIELPRNVVYDTTDYGFLGFFSGLGKGIAYTGGRIGCGLSDILTLGFLSYPNSLYNAFGMQYYAWDEPWQPPYAWNPPYAAPQPLIAQQNSQSK